MGPAEMFLTKSSSYSMIGTCLAGIYEMTKPSHTSAPNTQFYQVELTQWLAFHIELIWSKNENERLQLKKFDVLKFMFFKNASQFDKIFTVDLTLCSKCQIDGEDFVKFCDRLRKHELYEVSDTKVVPMRYSIK